MDDDGTKAATDPSPVKGIEPSDVGFTDLEAARKLVADGDAIRRFQLQMRLDIYDRLSRQLEAGTALYEKLILLDGAIIALSITFLASLSSHFASLRPAPEAHLLRGPHLWMVAASWILLIISVYFSYRTIVDRHGASIRHITSISADYHKYAYERLGVVLTGLGSVIKGKLTHADKTYEISKLLEGLNAALKAEGETTVKKMDDFILEGKTKNHEGAFARIAINSAILGILMLCAFTIMSLRTLF